MPEPGISLISTTRSFRPVALITSPHRRNKKSFWYFVQPINCYFRHSLYLQRSILEADQEEENEEAGDMNDDELNMMLARNDGEIQIFRHMDIQREREALEAWRARGHRGKPPQPLVQLDELPECYRTDEPFEVTVLDESMEGRGQRRRNVVSYTDGLSDEQWAMVSPISLSLLPSFISAFISGFGRR
jgi:hypothetical protein